MRDQIEEVKSKTDIVQIIGERLELKKAGKNYKAVCPFHAEKTPSFNVSPDLQIFKCFGCNESGDVFSFLEKYEGMEFYEALKMLAERSGIKLEPINQGHKSEREKIFETNLVLEKFFQYILFKHKAGEKPLKYLFDRGLKKETIVNFGIGYCPEKPLSYTGHLIKHGLKIDDARNAGVVYKSDRGDSDRFRGRITFPLYDHRGNICGFSGRILPWMGENLAKYINTPETPAYYKSKILFGLNLSKNDIKKSDTAIVVEGELDMISCFQVGIKNTVAIKGSALTLDQVKLLARYCKRIILALDADIAGNAATKRGIEIAQKEGFEILVSRLEGYKDPDEMAHKNPEGLKKSLSQAVNIWDYLINLVFSDIGANKITSTAASKELAFILSIIDDSIIQAQYTNKVADKLDVPFEAVREQVKKVRIEESSKPAVEVAATSSAQKSRRELLEERLFKLLFHNDPVLLSDKMYVELFTLPVYKKLIEIFSEYTKKNKKFDALKFSSFVPAELKETFENAALSEDESDEIQADKEISVISAQIEIMQVKEKMLELSRLMEKEDVSTNNMKLKKLNIEFTKSIKRLKELEEKNYKGIIS